MTVDHTCAYKIASIESHTYLGSFPDTSYFNEWKCVVEKISYRVNFTKSITAAQVFQVQATTFNHTQLHTHIHYTAQTELCNTYAHT